MQWIACEVLLCKTEYPDCIWKHYIFYDIFALILTSIRLQ